MDVIMERKSLLSLPPFVANLAGRLLGQMISPILTEDMVNQLLEDNVLVPKTDVLTFTDLDIKPESMDRHAFDYLHRFRRGGHFTLVKGYH